MKRFLMIPLAAMAAIIVLDQAAKGLIRTNDPGWKKEIIPDFFNLYYVNNTGVAFGLFSGYSRLFGILAAVAVIVLFFMFMTTPRTDTARRWAFTFLIGGAMGNLVDRLFRGHVTDFLDFQIRGYHWPAFNVADMAVCLGVGIFIVKIFTEKEEPAPSSPPLRIGTAPQFPSLRHSGSEIPCSLRFSATGGSICGASECCLL